MANTLQRRTGIMQPVPERYRTAIERILYVSCRSLLEDQRTRATVAGSIRNNGLSLCPGRLSARFEPTSSYRDDCRSQASQPTLQAMAEGARLVLLNETLLRIRQTTLADASVSNEEVASVRMISDAIAVERRHSSLPSERYAEIDRTVVEIYGEAARTQNVELASIDPSATSDVLVRTERGA